MSCAYLLTLQFLLLKVLMHFLSLNNIETMEIKRISKNVENLKVDATYGNQIKVRLKLLLKDHLTYSLVLGVF